MISLTDVGVRWALIAAACGFVVGKAYLTGRDHGYEKRDREAVAAMAAKNAEIDALSAKQAATEAQAQERTNAAVRAAVAGFQAKGCRPLTEAERKRLNSIGG